MGEKKIRDRKENARTRVIFLGSFTQERERDAEEKGFNLSLSLSLVTKPMQEREMEIWGHACDGERNRRIEKRRESSQQENGGGT